MTVRDELTQRTTRSGQARVILLQDSGIPRYLQKPEQTEQLSKAITSWQCHLLARLTATVHHNRIVTIPSETRWKVLLLEGSYLTMTRHHLGTTLQLKCLVCPAWLVRSGALTALSVPSTTFSRPRELSLPHLSLQRLTAYC